MKALFDCDLAKIVGMGVFLIDQHFVLMAMKTFHCTPSKMAKLTFPRTLFKNKLSWPDGRQIKNNLV